MSNNDGDRKKKKKSKHKDDNPSGPQTIRSYKVTEEPDGTLVCNCPEFRATGKVCTEILAVRLSIEFGPPGPYFAVADKSHLDEPAAKGKKKPAKVTGGKARGSDKRGQHPLADHRVERDYEDFLGRLDKGWAPFDSDSEEFTDPDLETQPKKKKKSGEPKKPTHNRVSAGRPVVSTPLHPGRSSVSPTKFNHKPGPKGKAKNSLLPALPAASRMSALKFTNDSDDSYDEAIPESYKPLPAGNFTDNQKEGFVAGVNFTPEEFDLAGLDRKRWNSVNYTLRHDEAIEMADLVEATSLTIGSAILVLGPSLDHEAEQLQDIDWLTSDAEPIDHTGASVLKNAWLHSQSTSLKKILAFRYDPARVHWLLFEIDLSTEEMICYEPLSQHGEALDMAGLVLIAKFFKPGRAGNKPQLDSIPFSYKVKCLGIQPDGASCGFWMATTAFLIICGIPITKPIVKILKALTPVNIKEHWKWMLTAFRVEEQGLGVEAANNFLRPFGHGFSEDKWRCVARRPEWISRFNPEIFQQDMAQHIRDPDDPANHSTNMLSEKELELLIQDLDKESRSLTFGHESLHAEDLRRFMDGWANDEVINMFVSVLNHSHQPAVHPHFASAFGLCKVLQARQDADGSAQTIEQELADFDVLKTFLIPVNEPRNVHWLLLGINFESKTISVYDSWPAARGTSDEDVSGHLQPVGLSVLAAQIISSASQGKLNFAGQEWDTRRVSVPSQNNSNDCGFFVIMFILHLVHWGALNPPDCPPILTFSAKNMHKMRIILASAVAVWCASRNSRDIENLSQNSIEQATRPQSPATSDKNHISDIATDEKGPALWTESLIQQEAQVQTDAAAGTLSVDETRNSYSPVPSSVDGEDFLPELEEEEPDVQTDIYGDGENEEDVFSSLTSLDSPWAMQASLGSPDAERVNAEGVNPAPCQILGSHTNSCLERISPGRWSAPSLHKANSSPARITCTIDNNVFRRRRHPTTSNGRHDTRLPAVAQPANLNAGEGAAIALRRWVLRRDCMPSTHDVASPDPISVHDVSSPVTSTAMRVPAACAPHIRMRFVNAVPPHHHVAATAAFLLLASHSLHPPHRTKARLHFLTSLPCSINALSPLRPTANAAYPLPQSTEPNVSLGQRALVSPGGAGFHCLWGMDAPRFCGARNSGGSLPMPVLCVRQYHLFLSPTALFPGCVTAASSLLPAPVSPQGPRLRLPIHGFPRYTRASPALPRGRVTTAPLLFICRRARPVYVDEPSPSPSTPTPVYTADPTRLALLVPVPFPFPLPESATAARARLFESDEGEDEEDSGHWEGERDGEGSEHGWNGPVCEVAFPETPMYTREERPRLVGRRRA
ncbi:hypothetical protein DFH08DRAFT_961557 [Mycena albidolilacea]|uniref:Ubiquitin-like protease family profile domain-containing protein n=1 Tax=Mycena albidolilacea TaxID=1033008 RepID=A0AAD7ERG5_9AGAR|nr:hypothetical protein DFH08DRAFT_961557 [Mycena albidolilacea]